MEALTMDTLADEALTAHQQREERRRAERAEQEAYALARKEEEAAEAMSHARSAFVDRLGMSWDHAEELVHLAHRRTSGPGKRIVKHVVLSVPVEGLPEHAIVLVVNWPDGGGRAQIAVAERVGGVRSWASPSYGKRLESLADLGQLIVDRQELYDDNTADEF